MTDEVYLYTLMLYIEQNPLKAKMVKELKERNNQILKAYAQGYSQHMIAKVLGLSQPADYGMIKRSGK